MYKPDPSEYDPYYQHYISLVPEEDIRPALADQPADLRGVLDGVPEDKGIYAYAEGKWTIKEILSHLIDGERMFAYRLLRISRGDQTPIEGFEQDGYNENSNANNRSLAELLDEFELQRRSNMFLINNLNEAGWKRVGIANQKEISVRALANIMAGHVRHHTDILKDRYL